MFGPRDEWFPDESLHRLTTSVYTVTADSNRVGVRFTGPGLDRRTDAELVSEPTLRGAIEVPPDGLPIVFGADHPTTIGYPVVAVLDADSADRIAQCRPGQAVRFALTRPRVQIWSSDPR
jgi:allophanate hydrolase subunit 2